MTDEKEIVEAIKHTNSLAEVYDIVHAQNYLPLSSRIVSALARKIKNSETEADCKIALLSNFTLDLLPPFISAAVSVLRLKAECYVAPYNQHYQEVLQEGSGLHEFKPDTLVLSLALKELSPTLHYQFAELTVEQRQHEAQVVIDHVCEWLSVATKHLAANFLITNFIPPKAAQLGFADNREAESELEFYQKLNAQLRKDIINFDNASLLDIAALSANIGWKQVYDAKMYYMAKLIWSEEMMMEIGQAFTAFVVAAKGLSKKCLVLDLDNTLWGGVLGEEGIQGVKVGKGDAISEAYADFQSMIKAMKQRGVLLAICSKNNFEDVEDAFKGRTEMPLKLDDFAVTKINWEYKHQNIAEVAAELNISLDSLVFIDDNPVEVNMVRQMLPSVTSILLPVEHEKIPHVLDNYPLFEKFVVLEDDRNKTQQYVQTSERTGLLSQSTDIESYLTSLETVLTFKRVETADIQRAHQLFTKTNQFNVTTVRYELNEVVSFCNNSDVDFWCFSVKDRFGDLGLIGLILIIKKNDEAILDSFIMSCRSMGRGVETAVINWLKKHYLLEGDISKLIAKYSPTQKNKPVIDLYDKHGFERLAEDADGVTYQLKKDTAELMPSGWIKCDFIEN